MVTEVASIPVKAGQEEAFIRVFKTALVPVYAAPGCHPGRQFLTAIGPFLDGAARLEHLDEV